MRLDGIQLPIIQLLPNRFQCNLEQRICKSFFTSWYQSQFPMQMTKLDEAIFGKVYLLRLIADLAFWITRAKWMQTNGLKLVESTFKGKLYLRFTKIPVQIRLVLENSDNVKISSSEKVSKTSLNLSLGINVIGSHTESVPLMPFIIHISLWKHNSRSPFTFFNLNQQSTQKFKYSISTTQM